MTTDPAFVADPTIEVKDRRSGDRADIALADVVTHLVATCHP